MHITNLQTRNWKGRDLDLPLTPVTVVTGDNFAGKTSVPMAIRLALTGYLPPPIGKRNEAIFALAGDQAQPMSVTVTTDTGRKSSITLSKTAKGKVTLEGGVPADLALPGLLVEPTTFFGLSGPDRINAVFSACDVQGLTSESIEAAIWKLDVIPSKLAEEPKGWMVNTVKTRFSHTSIPDSLAKIEFEWKDELKSSKEQLARKQAELSAVSTITRDAPVFDAAKYAELSKQFEAVRCELNASPDLNKATHDLNRIGEELEDASVAVDVAQRELSDLDELDACPRCKASAKGWKHEVETGLKRDLEQARHTRESVAKKYDEAKRNVAQLNATELERINGVKQRFTAIQAEIQGMEVSLAAAVQWKAGIANRNAIEAEVMKLTASVECYKQGKELITKLREEAVDKSFGKVLTVARNFTDGLLNSPIEMVEGQLGRRVSVEDRKHGNTAPVGAWIPHEAFSGTEQLLAYAGFAVALAGQAPSKVVIMDELGRLTDNRKAAMLRRMCELVNKGVIDQFIGCDVEGMEVEGVNCIAL